MLINSHLGYVVSPPHKPEGKKEHRHLLLRNMHGHFLNFEKITNLLNCMMLDPPNGIEVGSGMDSVRLMVQYFVHLNQPDKEQFDLSDLNKIEFYSGGGLVLDRLLYSGRSSRSTNVNEEKYLDLFGYCYSPDCLTFADLCKYASQKGLLSLALGRAYAFKSLIGDIHCADKKAIETAISILRNNDGFVSSDIPKRDYEQQSAHLRKITQSNLSGDLWDWIVFKLSDILADFNTPALKIRQAFSSLYDSYSNLPRKPFIKEFDEWCILNNRGVTL